MESIPTKGVPRGGPPRVRPVGRLRPWLIGIGYGLVLIPLTHAPVMVSHRDDGLHVGRPVDVRARLSGNVISRYMTIEAIVERGTLAVETSPLRRFMGSPDVVKFGKHYYSDKPPVLSVLSSLIYLPLFGLGIRLSDWPDQFAWANLVLTSATVGVGSALVLVWLRQLLQTIPIARWAADLLTIGFGFGSLLFVYGVTFNNHSVAAALMMGAFTLVTLEDPASPGLARRRALTGLLAGLAAVIELPTGGTMLAALTIWLACRQRSIPWAFLAGVSGPLLLHALLQSLVTGTPLPAELYPKSWKYRGSYWATPQGEWKERGPRWRWGLELIFGPQGWITVTPVLVFGVVGLALVIADLRSPLRSAALTVAGTIGVVLVYYVWGLARTDHAGKSFGSRHLLALTPPLYFFAVVALARLRRHLVCVVFAALFGIGCVYAIAGMKDPWSRIEHRDDSGLRAVKHTALYPWSSDPPPPPARRVPGQTGMSAPPSMSL